MPNHDTVQDSKFYDPKTHSYVLTVESPGALESPYVDRVYVNGAVRDGDLLHLDDFSKGGNVRFDMATRKRREEYIHEEL